MFLGKMKQSTRKTKPNTTGQLCMFLRSLGVICYDRWVLSRVTKVTSRNGASWTHSLPFCFQPILTQWIMAILSKRCKPDTLNHIWNSLKLCFTNIRGLRSNFVDFESFLELNSHDILALCETNLDDSERLHDFSVTIPWYY